MAATKRQRNSVFPDEEKTEKLSVQTKTVLYQLYAQQHSTGKTLKSFLADLAAIGHPVPKRTFQQWGHNIERQGSAGSLAKASGRPNALDDEKLLILSGFIFLSNDEGREVHLLDYVNTAKEVFDVDISTATASRYLRAWGFCSKVTQRKQGALKQDPSSFGENDVAMGSRPSDPLDFRSKAFSALLCWLYVHWPSHGSTYELCILRWKSTCNFAINFSVHQLPSDVPLGWWKESYSMRTLHLQPAIPAWPTSYPN